MEGLIVLAILLFLAGPVLAIVAIVQVSGLNERLRKLRHELDELKTSGFQVAAADIAASPTPEAKEAAIAASTPAPPEVLPETIISTEAAPVEVAPAPKANVEQALASRWLVWLGGAAVALGGLLLVKYANDVGLISPFARVVVGLLFGAGLVVAAEWLRKRQAEQVQTYVPAALSAAGLVIAFGVTYAAYALYNIVAPAVCFPMLVAISLGALWLSKRQGPLIAALGLVGAYATPAMISTENPSASGFFAYLLVIVAASLWQLRSRAWWWLGFAAIGGATAWAVLWMLDVGARPSLPIGLFGLLMGLAAVWLPRGKAILAEEMGNLAQPQSLAPPMMVAIAGVVAGSAVLALLAVYSAHATLPLMMFAIAMAAIVGFGWMRNGFVAAPVLAALASLAVLMAWADVGFYTWAFDEQGFWTTVPGLIEPPRFRNATLLAGLGFTMVGLLGVWRKADFRPWALLAAASSFLFIFGAWGKADFTLAWQSWAGIAAAAALALLFAVWKFADRQENAEAAQGLEMLVAGAALLALFALDRIFDGVWFTISIAALAAALAYLTRFVRLQRIGGMASAAASFAAARLFVGREFWGDQQQLPLGAHWPLYGYGIPAALAWQASRFMRGDGFGRWRVALEGLSLGLLISLVSLELRVLIGGSITHDGMSFLEAAAHACAWLGAAFGLAYRQQLYSSFVSVWGARALMAGSTLLILGMLTVLNPVFSGDPLQGGQVFNALWLAYLGPAILLALLARKIEGLGWPKLRNPMGIASLVLVMAFVTMLVKRQFFGPDMEFEFRSQAESYAVSLAWLVLGIGIFVAGLKLDRQNIRYGGLAVLVLTVIKVFGFDLFSLGGLWRIASMIGLGLCLVGVGWLYTRFLGKPAQGENTKP